MIKIDLRYNYYLQGFSNETFEYEVNKLKINNISGFGIPVYNERKKYIGYLWIKIKEDNSYIYKTLIRSELMLYGNIDTIHSIIDFEKRFNGIVFKTKDDLINSLNTFRRRKTWWQCFIN